MEKLQHTVSHVRNTRVHVTDYNSFLKRCGKTTVLVTNWRSVLRYDCANMWIDSANKKKIREYCKYHMEYNKQHDIWSKKLLEINFADWMDNEGKMYLLDYSTPKWEEISKMLDQNDEIKPKRKYSNEITTVHQVKGLEMDNVFLDSSMYSLL